MSVWMSEKEFRHGDLAAVGITLNVPFLREIKQDYEFREMLNEVAARIGDAETPSPRQAFELLCELRDQLETYFALEEFYGYFKNSATINPDVSQQALDLKSDHEKLFLQLNAVIETSEQIVYRECSPEITVKQLAEQLDAFCKAFATHEECEMELMMRMCNEDIGVGD